MAGGHYDKSVYNELVEFMKRFDDMKKETDQKIAGLNNEISDLKKENKKLKKENELLKKENELLKEDNTRLKNLLNHDSSNTSKPPSSVLLKREILSGLVLVLCVTGAFAVSNSVFNIWVMIVFAAVGYFMNKFKLPQSPLILAMVLGSMMEKNYLQSMVLSDGSWSIFVTRPISLVLLIISILFIAIPLYKRFVTERKKQQHDRVRQK